MAQKIPFDRWDGHCHTGFCPHGSGDPTERFVQAAVAQGFTHLTLTEHPLFPAGRIPDSMARSIYLDPPTLAAYLDEAERLRARYADRMRLRIGLEMDFVPGVPDFPHTYLDRFGHRLDDAVLSIHFLPDGDRLRPLDVTPDEVERLVRAYGSVASVRRLYWETWLRALDSAVTWDARLPRRAAHLDVVGKYEDRFPAPSADLEQPWVERVLLGMRELGFSLECNAQGLDVPSRRRPYPAPWIVALARSLGISLVYGSDAHSPDQVGRHVAALRAMAEGTNSGSP